MEKVLSKHEHLRYYFSGKFADKLRISRRNRGVYVVIKAERESPLILRYFFNIFFSTHQV